MESMGGGGAATRVALVIVFGALAVFYAVRASDVCLCAHAPHLLMTAGMLYMLMPLAWQVLPLGLWLAVFGAASGWCVVRTAGRWRRDHHLDLEFAHSELAGCVAMTAMLPLFAVSDLAGALPLTIALGTYFLVYTVFWGWRVWSHPEAPFGETAVHRTRAEGIAQIAMGGGMACMFLVM